MTHAELIQVATDLLYAAPTSEQLISEYDRALSSENDYSLSEFVTRLQLEQMQPRRMAA